MFYCTTGTQSRAGTTKIVLLPLNDEHLRYPRCYSSFICLFRFIRYRPAAIVNAVGR